MQIDNSVNEYLAYQIPSQSNRIANSKISKAILPVSLLSNNTSILIALRIIFYFVIAPPALIAFLTLLSVHALSAVHRMYQTYSQITNLYTFFNH